MTRDTNWKEVGRENITSTLDESIEELESETHSVLNRMEALKQQVEDGSIERRDLRDEVLSIKKKIIELGHTDFRLAKEVAKLESGSAIRNYGGKEPVGYSKSDGGAAHDAHYAARVHSLDLGFRLTWRLRLENWEKVTGRKGTGGAETVSAEGTKKFESTIGERGVAVIIDERGYSPI